MLLDNKFQNVSHVDDDKEDALVECPVGGRVKAGQLPVKVLSNLSIGIRLDQGELLFNRFSVTLAIPHFKLFCSDS